MTTIVDSKHIGTAFVVADRQAGLGLVKLLAYDVADSK